MGELKGINFYEVLKKLIVDFHDNKIGLEAASYEAGIPPESFKVFVDVYLSCPEEQRNNFRFVKYESKKVFSNEQEDRLKDYVITLNRIHYGLSPKEIMTLAYNFAKRNKNMYPVSWDKNKQAGYNWLRGFLKRSVEFPVDRKNSKFLLQECITKYFDNLSVVYDNLPIGPCPQNIFVLDETDLTTLDCSHPIGEATCDGKGAIVRAFCFMNAMGCVIPPFLIYPDDHYNEKMLAGVPSGTIGIPAKNWSNDVLFLDMLKHFHESVKSTPESPVVFIFYNNEAETSVETLEFCRDHGIILISLPPTIRTLLQPLCNLLRITFASLRDDRLLKEPTKIVNIYDVGGLLGTAFEMVYQHRAIINDFELTGIWPFNRSLFDSLEE